MWYTSLHTHASCSQKKITGQKPVTKIPIICSNRNNLIAITRPFSPMHNAFRKRGRTQLPKFLGSRKLDNLSHFYDFNLSAWRKIHSKNREEPYCQNSKNPKNWMTNLIAITQPFSREQHAFWKRGRTQLQKFPNLNNLNNHSHCSHSNFLPEANMQTENRQEPNCQIFKTSKKQGN